MRNWNIREMPHVLYYKCIGAAAVVLAFKIVVCLVVRSGVLATILSARRIGTDSLCWLIAGRGIENRRIY